MDLVLSDFTTRFTDDELNVPMLAFVRSRGGRTNVCIERMELVA